MSDQTPRRRNIGDEENRPYTAGTDVTSLAAVGVLLLLVLAAYVNYARKALR